MCIRDRSWSPWAFLVTGSSRRSQDSQLRIILGQPSVGSEVFTTLPCVTLLLASGTSRPFGADGHLPDQKFANNERRRSKKEKRKRKQRRRSDTCTVLCCRRPLPPSRSVLSDFFFFSPEQYFWSCDVSWLSQICQQQTSKSSEPAMPAHLLLKVLKTAANRIMPHLQNYTDFPWMQE